ncbi:HEAT repeat domain-containing protein [Geminocystis sp.]|uniref:HEAT repeat domain-containing protein n=1 Tax=Geminocystis sp. TaxID=2664100 RepID=UPI003593B3FD
MNTSTIITPITQLISAVEKADSAPKLYETVVELANCKSLEAIPTLIQVLGYNNPGAAVAATEGLIALGESVIEPLLRSLDNYNYGARAWAVRVFAGIGDIRALDLLTLSALNDFSLSVRRAATKGLGNLQWHQLPSENIIIIQTQVLETLLVTANDGEWVVRYASIVSLEDLYQSIDSTYQDLLLKIIHTLKEIITIDAEIAIQSRAKLALKKIDNK